MTGVGASAYRIKGVEADVADVGLLHVLACGWLGRWFKPGRLKVPTIGPVLPLVGTKVRERGWFEGGSASDPCGRLGRPGMGFFLIAVRPGGTGSAGGDAGLSYMTFLLGGEEGVVVVESVFD